MSILSCAMIVMACLSKTIRLEKTRKSWGFMKINVTKGICIIVDCLALTKATANNSVESTEKKKKCPRRTDNHGLIFKI